MKKVFYLLISLFVITSCGFDNTAEDLSSNEDYKDFNLNQDIVVNSDLPRSRVLLFDTYPISEDGTLKNPLLSALSPFTYEIRVPKGLESLYVYVNGEILEYANRDITISETAVRTKVADLDLEKVLEGMDEKFIMAYVDLQTDVLERRGLFLFEDMYPFEGDYDFNDLVAQFTIRRERITDENSDRYGETLIAVKTQLLAMGAYKENILTINMLDWGVEPIVYEYSGLNDFKNVFDHQTSWVKLKGDYSGPIPRGSGDAFLIQFFNGTDAYNNFTYYLSDAQFPNMFEVLYTADFNRFYWPLEFVRIDQVYPRYDNWVKNGCLYIDADWYMDAPTEGRAWMVEIPEDLTYIGPLFN